MKELDIVSKLAEAARRERPPAVDVTEKVMLRLSVLEERTTRFWPFAAALSLATAAAFMLAVEAWTAARDPVVEVLSSIRTVMP